MAADWYAILGVGPGASAEEIKRAYRKLAVELHPDRNPAAEDHFKKVSAAWEVLGSVQRRRAYDEDRVVADPWRGRPKKAAGADLRYRLEVPFEDAVRGTTVSLEVRRAVVCRACEGCGAPGGADPEQIPECRDCHGKGKIAGKTCRRCRGKGEEPLEICADCGGSGRVQRLEALEVPVPAGVETGKRLRVTGFGDAGTGGGAGGDLFVEVTVAGHPLLTRRGSDVLLDLPVSLVQVLLEEEVSVPTPDGEVRIRLPHDARTGMELTLDGRGVADPEGERGDQIITLTVIVPGKLDAAQREALRAFRAARPPGEEPAIARFLRKKRGR